MVFFFEGKTSETTTTTQSSSQHLEGATLIIDEGSSIFCADFFFISNPFAMPILGPKIRTWMQSAFFASTVFPSKSSMKLGGAKPHPSLPFSLIVIKLVDSILRTYSGWEEGVGEVKSYDGEENKKKFI